MLLLLVTLQMAQQFPIVIVKYQREKTKTFTVQSFAFIYFNGRNFNETISSANYHRKQKL